MVLSMLYKIVFKMFYMFTAASIFILPGCSNVRLQTAEEAKKNFYKLSTRHVREECYKLISTIDMNDCLDRNQKLPYEKYLEIRSNLD